MKTGHIVVMIIIAVAAAIGAYILAVTKVSSLREQITRLEKDLQDTNAKLAAAETEIGKLTGLHDKFETNMQALSETCGRLSEQSAEFKREQVKLASGMKELQSASVPVKPAVVQLVEESQPFDEEELLKEVENLHSEAQLLYRGGMKMTAGKLRNAELEKAADKCNQAIERLEKIRQYYEDNTIRPAGGQKFVWEDVYQKVAQTLYEINRDTGF